MRPDKRRRYGDALRQRILDWLERCNGEGITDTECSRLIGMKVYRFTMSRRAQARLPVEARESLAVVPLESSLLSSTVALLTPSGYRVVGLGLGQLLALLRELV